MDLSSVRRKLNNSLYSYVHEFFSDLLLIWHNCRLFNSDDCAAKYFNLALQMELNMLQLIQETLP